MAIYQEYPKTKGVNRISDRVNVVFNMETGAVFFDLDNLLALAGKTDGGLVTSMADGHSDVTFAEVYTKDRGFVPMLFVFFAMFGYAATGGNIPT